MDASIFNAQFQTAFTHLILALIDRLQAVEGNTVENAAAGQDSEAGELSSSGRPGRFEDLIRQAAARYEVDPRLVKAVIRAESAFNPKAVSSAGAQGLMQLMPATAAGLGVKDAFDPQENVNAGVRLLRQLLKRYDENVSLALAAYNAGPGAVNRYGGIPPFRETQVYVQRVLNYWKSEKDWSG